MSNNNSNTSHLTTLKKKESHLRFLFVNLWINFLTNVADLQVGSSVWYNVIPLWFVFERMNYYNFN